MPIIKDIHKSNLEVDLTSKLVKTSNTVATLGSLTLTTSVSGAGGLDSGTIAVSTFYYVYCVISGGLQKLVASTSAISPTGFTTYRKVGAFYTDTSSNIFKVYYYGETNQTDFEVVLTSSSGIASQKGNAAASFSHPTITLNSGIFSIAPFATGTPNSSWVDVCTISGSTTTSVSIQTGFWNSSQQNTFRPCNILINKFGIDAVLPDWSRL